MKKLFTFLAVLSFAKSFSQPLPELLYYRFDSLSPGIRVPNWASTPPAGTDTAIIMGGLTQGSSGQCGNALIGSGVSSTTDYLNTGYAIDLSGSWTISVWTSNFIAGATLYYIFGDNSAGAFRCFTNGVAGANNWILRGSGTADVLLTGGATVAPHVNTFVYDSSAGNIKAYLDGSLVNTVAQGNITIAGTGPFKVMGYSANVGAPAGGLLDEFRMYNRALTDSEVMQLFTLTASNTISDTTCDSYTVPSGDTTYTLSGTYIDTIPRAYCGDSILTINLTIKNSTSSSFPVTACDSMTSPSGNYTWDSSGTYMDTIPNSVGCDSVMTVDLTIKNSTSASFTIAACDSFAWQGNTYSSSGTYMDTLPNSVACDSVMTLNLTIKNSSSASFTITACDSFTWQGNTYSSSGTHLDTIPNSVACDSMMTLNLTIKNSTSASLTITACDSFTWQGNTYTSSGMHVDIIPNDVGCDSVMTLNLTINTVDTSVSVNGITLTSNASGAVYQWVDCNNGNSSIAGATNQSYMPTGNGSYAVVVTLNGCSGTSACINVIAVGIGVTGNNNQIVVYPNPNNGSFTIQSTSEGIYFILNEIGQTIQSVNLHAANKYTMNIENLGAGIYFIIGTDEGQITRKKVVVIE